MVIGPNQKRCRGRSGLSVGEMKAVPLYFVAESGPLMLTLGPVAAGEVRAVAARRAAGVLHVAVRIHPHPDHEIDVFLPEPLVLVGDRRVQRRGVVGRGGHVGRNRGVIHDVARAQLRGKRVRPDVLNPVQNGLVVDDVVARRILPVAVGIVELGVVVQRRHAVGQKEELLPPVVGRVGGPDEERLPPVVRTLGIAVERLAGEILVTLADEVLVRGVGQAGAAGDFIDRSAGRRRLVAIGGQIGVADRSGAGGARGREGRDRRAPRLLE